MPPTPRRRLPALLLAAILAPPALSAGCAVPVSAKHVGPDEVYVSVHRTILNPGTPSAAALLVLERSDLLSAWEEDPEAALRELHRMAVEGDTRERLFGLAELSLAHGLETEDRRWHLAAAVYAWLYLFGAADRPPPTAFDPRFRVACDLYARGLSEAFRGEDGAFVPEGGLRPLAVGSIELDLTAARVTVGPTEFSRFLPADDFEVHGIRTRVRREGLGVPLIAVADTPPEFHGPGVSPRLPAVARTAANAFLDVQGELVDVEGGTLRGTLRLSRSSELSGVEVRGVEVPLAADTTTPLAHGLTTSKLWDFELLGFLSRDEAQFPNGLVLAQPYQRGKVPVVLVHGTASSPARWADLANELWADPAISEHCQIWLFIYGTGAPILASAASLRDSIRSTLESVDPDGTDEALRHMVVIGHSQGGLLTRLMATDSGDRFWENVSDQPFESLDMTAEERATLRDAIFFEPVPEVSRVVFVCTPHRGSYVAGNWIGKIGAWLVSLPKKMTSQVTDVVKRNLARIRGNVLGSIPTAVDNMAPGSAFCRALADLPIAEGVRVHSIVAVDGTGPVADGDDGVVAYESAHLPSAESEIVVRSPHSAQGHPRTILEVRRILREHLADIDAAK
jgi:pimeloyl-ACP methyl ester carboxylesterase